jgi:hypothetical protein
MPILHIEHAISDLDSWLETFLRLSPAREQAGVTDAQIFQPDDDAHYIVVNLRFETVSAAMKFRTFLTEQVWATPEASPALVGAPRALVLNEVDVG